MSIKVLVNGALGRMGQVTVNAIASHPHLELVGQIGRGYDLTQSIKDSQAEVVVDFTHPKEVYQNTLTIIEAGARPVIGTSGLTLTEIESLTQLCAKLNRGAIIAPNFAIGAVLMIKCAQEIAKYMPQVEIIEMHHDGKADSPSGTALRTAQTLAAVRRSPAPEKRVEHETVAGARGANVEGIAVHAIRLPGLVAHQQIIFGTTGETLTLRNDCIDRECFMPGVCLACEKVMELNKLIYGLETLL